ncbi:SMAD/FHA domain-containing protein [Gilbertella persicaria]|uniref:SMAD/FHA domain-containing protein n=1 Tax=Gilbertella persicaria TaxID=101096 RepID=UPI002220828D|nr:SMAD/FHA domain-containing protein [Gilbertella persicaria]KAI8047835.1 SMAD/FHA domain-containing protein [Gilbertella persicaria]
MSDKQGFAVPSLPASKRKPEQEQEEQVRPQPPVLQYETPSWSAPPSFPYRLEVLKNGASIETIQGPKKEYVTIGRLPLCDIQMEHPSVSRYQAIIQFDHDGDAYLYDMQSAHGTRLNKKPVPAREHVPLKPGDQIRFGESTRICIFDSEKPYDPETEAEERRKKALRERIAQANGQPEEEEVDQGITWGFAEDAQEEDDDDQDDISENTIEDIKANLNKSSGDADLLTVEAQKQAFEDAKRRREDIELMYNDDSDEELYDKTSRKKKKKEEKADTHDDLVRKQNEAEQKIQQLEQEIADRKQRDADNKANAQAEEEDLDMFMKNLSKKPLQNEKSMFLLQKELSQLKKDHERLVKLVKLTKPSHIL